MESILRAYEDKNKVQEHACCSYAYIIVSNLVEFEPKTYFGLNAAEHFLDSLQHDLNTHIMPIIEKDAEMIWNDDAKLKFEAATQCHICEKDLVPPELHCHRDEETSTICHQNTENKRVRDHCHLTGNFVGASHNTL